MAILLDTKDLRRSEFENLSDHHIRVGSLPDPAEDLLRALEESGLRGRGGAAFPVGAKWAAVAARRDRPVILVNGAEGEPLSEKDRSLLAVRPHLVLDGAFLAARTLRAKRVVVYIGADHQRAVDATKQALQERSEPSRIPVSLVKAPMRFVAGEETAAVHCVNEDLALPQTKPPRPFQRGVDGRPTLVQNVETLAWVALIARHGAEWYRRLGREGSPGAVLLTLSGAVRHPGVIEAPGGATVGDAVGMAGGEIDDSPAMLLGGYFGGWTSWEDGKELALDPMKLRSAGRSLGSGVLHLLPGGACGVIETASILSYLASESARQCGPCTFGLRAISNVVTGLAANRATSGDLGRIARWGREIRGRGACAHPDGAANFLESALLTFEDEFVRHQERRGCAQAA